MHHLAKAALAQNHDEVEVRELDPVLIAIAVVLAHRRGGRRVCWLPWTYPRPLKGERITGKDYEGRKNKPDVKKKGQHKLNLLSFLCLTSNFCRSSSLPSSPSGWTGTLKYSPSSWDSSLNLNHRIKTGLLPDYDNKALKYSLPCYFCPHLCDFPNYPLSPHFLVLTSYHPSTPCFNSSEIPKDRDPMKSFLLVRSQSQTSTDRRRSLSLSFSLLRNERKGGGQSDERSN